MTSRLRYVLALSALTMVLLLTGIPSAAAHGIGGRADLPVPVSFFIIGAGIAVVASFLALAVLWPEPRLQKSIDGPVRSWKLGVLGRILTTVGVVGLVLVLLTGLFNEEGGRTISPVIVWVYFWLVVPFVGAAIGNWWISISPWRFMAKLINGDVEERTDTAAKIGVWPAVVAFLAFTWLELVPNSSDGPRTLALVAIGYSLYLLIATRYLGVETGLSSAGAFENYNGVIAAIAPIRWTTKTRNSTGDGVTAQVTLTYRGWLRGLTVIGHKPGFTALVIAMIGTVTYDGMSGSSWWSDTFSSVRNETWFGTLAFAETVLIIGGAYWLASYVASYLAGGQQRTATIARSFAHTLVPIALAYALAHYFTLVLVEGQLLLHTASDPFGLGWNLFGTAGWRISWVPAPEVIWYFQVAAIVAGHVAGVVLAHDRALHEFGHKVAVRTQYAMLVLMVALTSLGLLILSG